MNERPILFSSPMVKAILEGRKTQTRRIAKVTDKWCKPGFISPLAGHTPRRIADHVSYCPYGQLGDRLWVKEAIRRGYCGDMEMSAYVADGSPTSADAWPWKAKMLPSMFCPRGLSRITLEVTGVRVKRLQEINGEDAEAEGAELTSGERLFLDVNRSSKFRDAYQRLWDSLNAKRGYGWDKNPYVWIIEFKRAT